MLKALILYDSQYGNTERIAQAIRKGLVDQAEVDIYRISNSKLNQLQGINLLVVGSPTQGFRPTKLVVSFLNQIPNLGLAGVKVAAFDTRIALEDIDSTIGRFFVSRFGYAAKPIADRLKKKGGQLILPPEGFLVKGVEGPLKDGEYERAEKWGTQIIEEVGK